MSDTKCICCGADVPLGSLYCPNCLITQLKHNDYEEVNYNGYDGCEESDL